MLPYQFEPEAGANVSNISDENSEQGRDLSLSDEEIDHELERVMLAPSNS